MKAKRILATIFAALIVCGSAATLPAVSAAETTSAAAATATAARSSILPTDVTTASAGCTLVGIKGDFIADSQAALDRINEIRYEACKEGVKNPSTGAPLTLNDYVPIKWSSDLEYIARIRAAEASAYLEHTRPNGTSCFTLRSPNGVGSYGEVLAWNWSNSMVPGIEQWYGEKDTWVTGGSGVTGHYTQMIDPENTYVGLGCFCTKNTIYYNTTCGEFTSQSGLDGTMAAGAKGVTQTIEVQKNALANLKISGKTILQQGKSTKLELTGIVNLSGESLVTPLETVTWTSSNPSAVSVDENGTITRLAPGTATITVTTSSRQTASLQVTEKLAAPTPKISSYSPATIKVSWNKVSGASGYVVYRSTSKTGTYKKIGSTAGCSATSYTDQKVTAGKKYYYKVKACGTTSDANSDASKIISAVPRLKTPVATAKRASYTSIKVSWNKVSGATGYSIYRATSKTGTYKKIATTKSSTTSYTNKGLTTGKTYYYKVVATGKKASYRSASSSIVSAKPTLATVSNVTASKKSLSKLTLKWNKVSGATKYQVYRTTSKTGTYKKIATVTTNTYTNSGLKTNTTYYYKVRAVRGSVAGNFSAIKSAKISHTHSWKNTYKTVSRPATYTTVTVPTYDWKTVKICDWCKQEVKEDGSCGCVEADRPAATIRTMHNEFRFVQDGEETYKVKNTKAYTAKVLTGKKCSTCGATETIKANYDALDAKHHVHDYVTKYDAVHHDATYTTVETPERKLVCHSICNGCGIDKTGWTLEQTKLHSQQATDAAFENFKRLSGSESYTGFINTYANGNGPAHGYPDDYNLRCGGYHSEYEWEYTGNTTVVDKCVTEGSDEAVEAGEVCTICGATK